MKKIILALFAAALIMCSNVQEVCAHYDTAYWHDTNTTLSQRDWMKNLDDSRKISSLSIPGTHNSMAHKDNLDFIDNTRTQSMSLENQLESGIRYLDIRLKYQTNGFPIHHGIVYLGYDFEDVLQKTAKFLKDNPSETIVMRIKQEDSTAYDRDMKIVFDRYYKRYKSLFWDSYKSNSPYNPTLGELRGKVLLLSDIFPIMYGMSYRYAISQDAYNIPNNWELYTKWQHVKDQFINSEKNRGGALHINYLSAGSTGIMPYFVASGHSNPATGAPRLATGLTEPGFSSYYPDFPRVNWFGVFATIAFEGTNTLSADYISANRLKYAGIVVADFPGERLIKSIIACNDYNMIQNNSVYTIALKTNDSVVIDQNYSRENNATLYRYLGGTNQKWKFIYDSDRKAYQIESVRNPNMVLAWNDYNCSSNVFITPNQKKPEHYWTVKTNPNDSLTFVNYKNKNKVLQSDTSSTADLTNIVVKSSFSGNRNAEFILK